MRLYVFDLGSLTSDRNLMVSMSHIAKIDDPECRNSLMEFPVPGFLIETEVGYILYDTGCHPDCMGKDGRWPEAFQKQVYYCGDKSNWIVTKLKQLGIEPEEIKTIVLSHMHNDHAGCIEYFPNARFIVHRDEFDACIRCYATHRYMDSYIWKDTDAWIRQEHDWKFLENGEGDHELCPGVTVLNLGAGHARGVLGLMVELEKTGAVIITSDAVYCSDNYDHEQAPGVIYDTLGWQRSLRRIKYIAKKKKAQVWFGHDRRQFDQLKLAPEFFYE